MPVGDRQVDADTEKACYSPGIERNESRHLFQTEPGWKLASHGFGPGLGNLAPRSRRLDARLHERCKLPRRKNRSRRGTIQGGMCVHQPLVLDLESSFSAANQNCTPSPVGFPAASHF